jgi:DNA invertase Pin-like site-specific DNA recombinase
MTKYIAYYRVSTQMQGKEGLGMEAQRNDVHRFLNGVQPIAEYKEVESSKDHKNRPELLKALDHCKAEDATLIVAKLDRLSRNLVFIGTLMESKVKFKCCDIPEADSFTIHIFAALAQKEREMISARTKAALKSLKDRGVKLGGPQFKTKEGTKAHTDMMRAARKPKVYDEKVLSLIKSYEGRALSEITQLVNSQDHKTSRGLPYTKVAIWRLQQLM